MLEDIYLRLFFQPVPNRRESSKNSRAKTVDIYEKSRARAQQSKVLGFGFE